MASWRLRVKCAAAPPAVLDGIAGDTEYGDLLNKLWALLQLDGSPDISLLSGFPPRPVTLGLADPISSALANGEVLTVQLPAAAAAAAGAGGKSATKGKAKTATSKPTARTTGGIHTLSSTSSGSGASRSTGAGNSSFMTAARSRARALNADPSDTTAAAGKKRKRGKITLSSTDGISDMLTKAVSGGTDTGSKFFRSALKRAVDMKYDETKAQARVDAGLAGTFTIAESQEHRTLSGEAAAMHVTFPKGLGFRSNHKEQVELVDVPKLRELITLLLEQPNDGKNILRPLPLAGSSPGVFWSLVHKFGGDTRIGLQTLCPEADWSFLTARERALSEKAKANLQQQQQQEEEEAAVSDDEIMDIDADETAAEAPDAAAAAAAAAAEARAAAANAAAARATAAAASAATVTTTAAAAAAAAAGAGGGSSGAATAAPQRDVQPAAAADEWWREEEFEVRTPEQQQKRVTEGTAAMRAAAAASGLDSSTAVDAAVVDTVGSAAVAQSLLQLGVQTVQQLANCEPDILAHALQCEESAVDDWLAAARGSLIDPFMEDVVQDEDVLQVLEAAANVSTPKDMVLMGRFADALVATVKDGLEPDEWNALTGKITVDAVKQWHSKCSDLLVSMPWLRLWVYDASADDSSDVDDDGAAAEE